MIAEFFRAAFLAGVPVALASFGLLWWALRSDYLEKTMDMKQLEKNVELLSKAQSKKKKHREFERKKLNPVHNKWLKFGGGFYGVVALITFVVIEAGEVISFLGALGENISRLADLSFDFLIRFIIDSMMNLVMALAWPMYWMDNIDMEHVWIWFLVAYGGYWLGARAAMMYADKEGAGV